MSNPRAFEHKDTVYQLPFYVEDQHTGFIIAADRYFHYLTFYIVFMIFLLGFVGIVPGYLCSITFILVFIIYAVHLFVQLRLKNSYYNRMIAQTHGSFISIYIEFISMLTKNTNLMANTIIYAALGYTLNTSLSYLSTAITTASMAYVIGNSLIGDLDYAKASMMITLSITLITLTRREYKRHSRDNNKIKYYVVVGLIASAGFFGMYRLTAKSPIAPSACTPTAEPRKFRKSHPLIELAWFALSVFVVKLYGDNIDALKNDISRMQHSKMSLDASRTVRNSLSELVESITDSACEPTMAPNDSKRSVEMKHYKGGRSPFTSTTGDSLEDVLGVDNRANHLDVITITINNWKSSLEGTIEMINLSKRLVLGVSVGEIHYRRTSQRTLENYFDNWLPTGIKLSSLYPSKRQTPRIINDVYDFDPHFITFLDLDNLVHTKLHKHTSTFESSKKVTDDGSIGSVNKSHYMTISTAGINSLAWYYHQAFQPSSIHLCASHNKCEWPKVDGRSNLKMAPAQVMNCADCYVPANRGLFSIFDKIKDQVEQFNSHITLTRVIVALSFTVTAVAAYWWLNRPKKSTPESVYMGDVSEMNFKRGKFSLRIDGKYREIRAEGLSRHYAGDDDFFLEDLKEVAQADRQFIADTIDQIFTYQTGDMSDQQKSVKEGARLRSVNSELYDSIAGSMRYTQSRGESKPTYVKPPRPPLDFDSKQVVMWNKHWSNTPYQYFPLGLGVTMGFIANRVRKASKPEAFIVSSEGISLSSIDSIFNVHTDVGMSRGFLVTHNGHPYVVCTHHGTQLSPGSSVRLTNQVKQEGKALVLSNDVNRDVTILKPDGVFVNGVTPLKCTTSIDVNLHLFVSAKPGGPLERVQSGKSELAGDRYLINDQGAKIMLQGVMDHTASTQTGDSGTPVMNSLGKVQGMHVANNYTAGRNQYITWSSIETVFPIGPCTPTNCPREGEIGYDKDEPYEQSRIMNLKHIYLPRSVRCSVLSGVASRKPHLKLKQTTRCPYYDKHKGTEFDVKQEFIQNNVNRENLRVTIDKFKRPTHHNPQKYEYSKALRVLEVCLENMITRKTRKLTIDEAKSRLKLEASAGYPLEKEYKCKGDYYSSMYFPTDYEHFVETLKEKPVKLLFAANPKYGELYLKEKADKARVVFAADPLSVLLTAQLFGDFHEQFMASHFKSHKGHTWSALGMSPFYGNFNKMAKQAEGKTVYSMDGKSFESKLSAEIQRDVFKLISKYAVCEEDKTLFLNLMESCISCYLVDIDGHLVYKDGKNGSGSGVTSILNTCVNIVQLAYGIFMQHPILSPLEMMDAFRLYVFGDDVLMILFRMLSFCFIKFQIDNYFAFLMTYAAGEPGSIYNHMYFNMGYLKTMIDGVVETVPLGASDKALVSLQLNNSNLHNAQLRSFSLFVMNFFTPQCEFFRNFHISICGQQMWSDKKVISLFTGVDILPASNYNYTQGGPKRYTYDSFAAAIGVANIGDIVEQPSIIQSIKLEPTPEEIRLEDILVKAKRVSKLPYYNQVANSVFDNTLNSIFNTLGISRFNPRYEQELKDRIMERKQAKKLVKVVKAATRPRNKVVKRGGKVLTASQMREMKMKMAQLAKTASFYRTNPKLHGLDTSSYSRSNVPKKLGNAVARKFGNQRLGGAPVAYNHQQHRSNLNMKTIGNTMRIVGKDRLATLNIGTNTEGEQIFTCVINPSEFGGERVRRFASCYDNYKVNRCVIHYAHSAATSADGELGMWFEMDPTDTSPLGLTGLKIGATHPSFRNSSFFENASCVMEKALSGRFYMEGDNDSDSDKRLTQQAIFECRIQVPSGALGPYTPIGTLWIEYDMVFSKPTIQTSFVGTCSVFQYPASVSASMNLGQIGSNGNIADAISKGAVIEPPLSNGGVVFVVQGSSSSLSAISPTWSILPGFWSIVFSGLGTVVSSAVYTSYVWEVSYNTGTTFSALPTNHTQPCPVQLGSIPYTNMVGCIGINCFINPDLIAAGETVYIRLTTAVSAGAVPLYSNTDYTFTRVFESTIYQGIRAGTISLVEQKYLDLQDRLQRLESKDGEIPLEKLNKIKSEFSSKLEVKSNSRPSSLKGRLVRTTKFIGDRVLIDSQDDSGEDVAI